jgi:hypothetical protein
MRAYSIPPHTWSQRSAAAKSSRVDSHNGFERAAVALVVVKDRRDPAGGEFES